MHHHLKYSLLAGSMIIAPLTNLQAAQTRPNIVAIILDDSGFSDLGSFGGEIVTPNLDTLAEQSVKFANFYSAATSSPSRAMYFTGRDSHQVGLGNMAELLRPEQKGQPGYETYLNAKYPAFPEILQQGGYQNFFVGKWHLGAKPGFRPSERGFEHYFAIYGGSANYYQKPDGSPNIIRPAELYQKRGTALTDYYENTKPVMQFPKDFYSTNFFGDKAISYLQQRDRSKPFYLHVAFNAPHWPLQAPEEVVQKYLQTYRAGWDQIRATRFARLQKIGLIPASAKLPTLWPDTPQWQQLSAAEKAQQTRKMAVYAAMVDVADQNVGKIINYLKQQGLYDNTVFFVMSDNGASNKDPSTDENLAIFSKLWIKDIQQRFNNATENIGHWNSFSAYTSGWAAASVTPFNRYKETLFEGGVHVWAFASYPGKTQPQTTNKVFSVKDVAPTLLELAQLKQPLTYRGHTIKPMEGISFANLLLGGNDHQYGTRTIGWEIDGMIGLRDGDYKLSSLEHDPHHYIYDLKNDPFETTDISEQQPKVKARLMNKYLQYSQQNGVIQLKTAK